MSSKEQIQAVFEWEGLQSKKKISRLQHPGKLLSGSATATIERDDSYELSCEVQGFTDDHFKSSIEFQNLVKPGPVEQFSFTGDCNGYNAVFSNCFIRGIQSSVDCDSGTYKNNSFRLAVNTYLFEQKVAATWKEVTHIDWFLNGPQDCIFSGRTSRQHDQGYSRKIEGFQNYKLSFGTSQPGFSADCAWIQLPGFSFVIKTVPEDFGPSWSKNFSIEYSTKLSPIPDEETRKAVTEIVSFVLGRRLIDIGDTSFTDEGLEFCMQNWSPEALSSPVKVKSDLAFLLRSWNPYGINVRGLCSKSDFPPIPIERIHRSINQNVEAIITKLVPVYLKHRDAFALDHALWRYWTFQELPLGVNLPMLVGGIEILAKAWFGSPYSTSQGNFTPKEQFLKLLKEDFESIRVKLFNAGQTDSSMKQLQNEKTLEALMNNLQGSFGMGLGARTRRFFEELGLQLTEKEHEALTGGRGKQVHGHSGNEDANELYLLSESLRTLFHKVMLKLLGYSGEYFDYAKHEVQELNSPPPQ